MLYEHTKKSYKGQIGINKQNCVRNQNEPQNMQTNNKSAYIIITTWK